MEKWMQICRSAAEYYGLSNHAAAKICLGTLGILLGASAPSFFNKKIVKFLLIAAALFSTVCALYQTFCVLCDKEN